jgi:hypothetical protein
MGYNLCNMVYPFLLRQAGPGGSPAPGAQVLRYGKQKPWQRAPRLTAASSLWWEAYFQARPEMDRTFRRLLHAAGDRLFERVARWAFVDVAPESEGERRSVA